MTMEAVRSAAGQAVAARFEMRDEALRRELEQVIALVSRDTYGQDDGRLAVKIRLICERDLMDRAGAAWTALRKSHQEIEGFQRPGLLRELHLLLDGFMRDGALRLAGCLREHSGDLKPVFSGRGAIDAHWIARQRRSATERQGQGIEDYLAKLPRTLMRR